jgi:hypothetical protein
MLSDLPTLKTLLRLAPSDSSQDAFLAGVLTAADRVVKLF